VLPDIEILVIAYLKAQTGRKAVTDLPAADKLAAALPLYRVTRVSGESRDYKLDHPIIDLDTFAPDRATASLLAREADDLLCNHLPYEHCVQPTGVVTAVSTVVGPRWLPDSNPNLRRFQASYEITDHA
jgi:hypothetical protein